MTATVGCGRSDPDQPRDSLGPDTARFSYGDQSVEVPLTACGRDGDVVVLAGRAGSTVLQAAADLGDGGADRTGVTADLGVEGIVGAFGTEVDHGPVGTISDIRAEGDRLIVEGTCVELDAALEPAAPASTTGRTGELVARCPEDDDTATGRAPPSDRGEVMGSASGRTR